VERTLLAVGREADVFLLADGSVLKLWRDPAAVGRLDREAGALHLLADHGLPAARVLDRVTIDGRPGLVCERLPGEDLMAVLAQNPLLFLRAGRVMGEVHAAMHECEGPPDLPELHDDLRERIAAAPPLPEELRPRVLELLENLPRGDRLCHGDLHIGNLLGSWDAPVVIDWGDAARGDPTADVARTTLIHRIGVPPRDAPLAIRVLAPVGQGQLTRAYLRSYRRHRPVDRDLLARWEVVRAAARLIEPIPEEHDRLLRIVRRGLARLGS
jgi:aminoglycoside phosphotransferase (APT) family kinase protein